MTALLVRVACAGFLLAVLWFDLMFDVQVLGAAAPDGTLPPEVVASIAAYYRRVTTDSWPMGALVATVMMILLAATLPQLRSRPGVGLAALVLAGVPIGLALTRVLPNAVLLGRLAGPPATDAALATAICWDHLLCLGGLLGFLALQIGAVRGRPPPT